MRPRLLQRIVQRPEPNVGQSDFVTRILASVVLVGAIVLVFPRSQCAHSLIKIALLIAAELGLVSVMLGLFLNAKTYFAGLQLFVTPLVMLRLVSAGLPWVSICVGVVALTIGIMNLVTRRSRLNQVLNLSSLREVIEDVSPHEKPPPPVMGARP